MAYKVGSKVLFEVSLKLAVKAATPYDVNVPAAKEYARAVNFTKKIKQR